MGKDVSGINMDHYLLIKPDLYVNIMLYYPILLNNVHNKHHIIWET